MQWRLKNLRISNFKFFYGNVDIPLDGKNLLLYGENGSGKSSIYWSLYTILQSCLKPDKPSATKYFEYDNQENLRNKFAKDSDYSGIVLEFVHSDGRTRTYENSTIRTNTQADDFIIKTAANSGFMNYKFLSSLFDFKNSEQNNIFKLIENQIFPFLNFKKDYTLIPYDNYVTSSNVGSWWKYINRCLIENGVLPRSNRKKNSILENTVQYNAYRKLINSFNNNLKELFDGIIEFANKKIDETFKLPIKLELSYEPAAFNILKPGTKKAKDSKLHEPKIILSAQYIHDLANDHTVYHPRSFFNEAKLTVVALALRMAIYEQTASYNDNSNCSEILVIDDLLISLDMGYRLKVIDVILDYVNKGKQLIFLTHDRALFNLVKNKIDVNGWKVLEMFSKYEGYSNDEIPVPVIYTSKSYLELAHYDKHIIM
jgi:hypothetical protein